MKHLFLKCCTYTHREQNKNKIELIRYNLYNKIQIVLTLK